MKIGDTVLFANSVGSIAGRYCHENDIAGEIVSTQPDVLLVDANLGYVIYASPSDLILADDRTPGFDTYGNPPKLDEIPIYDEGI